jgi:hypothetical protein
MDYDKEINALDAETLALNPLLRPAIVEGFDQSADEADSVAVRFGKSASSEHTVKAIRIIEEMRAVVLGNGARLGNQGR